jgi:hypothetical protein
MKTKLPILTGLVLCLVLGGFAWNAHGRPGLDALRSTLARSASEGQKAISSRPRTGLPPALEVRNSRGGDTTNVLASETAPVWTGQGRGGNPRGSADRPPGLPSDGQQFIKEAAGRVFQHPSIAAKLRVNIDLFGQQLMGAGKYLQLGEGEDKLLRLELSVQTDDHTLTFQQVCDGRFLWLRRDLPDSVDLGRIDLKRLRREVGHQPPLHAAARMDTWMALGGLPKLMNSLDENFDFAAPQPTELAGVKMLALIGRWKAERLIRLLPEQETADLQQPATIHPAHLPPHLPHRVNVLLGHDDLFPYRVEYLRQDPGSSGNRRGQMNGQPWTVMTRIDFREVSIPATIDPLQFVYQPDAAEIEDRTRAMVETLTASNGPGE